MRDLFKADAYPASKAAFHCLYFSPKRTTTISAFSIAFLVRIAFILAPLLSCQNFFSSLPSIFTPISSDNSRQAVYAFKGDVYSGLDADSIKKDKFEYPPSLG